MDPSHPALCEIISGGRKLSIPKKIEHIYRNFEPLTSEVVSRHLGNGDVFLDVGANFGYFSLLASALVGDSGEVLPIEASPEVLPLLHYNIQTNAIGNIEVFGVAAGCSEDVVQFYLTDDYVNSGVAPSPFLQPARTIKVRRTTIDALLSHINRAVSFIKIDVQGDEMAVLEGCRHTIQSSSHVNAIVEWAPAWMAHAGYDPFALPALLGELGFRDLTVIDEYTNQLLSVDEMEKIFKSDKSGKRFCNLFARKSS